MTQKICNYYIAVKKSPKTVIFKVEYDRFNLRVISHNRQKYDSSVAHYCGLCSGILISDTKTYCFHCQIGYELESLKDNWLNAPVLPAILIDYLRNNLIIKFNNKNLLKTRNKEDYRRVYIDLKSTAIEEINDKNLKKMFNELNIIFHSGQFNDIDLRKQNNQYRFTLDFYNNNNCLNH